MKIGETRPTGSVGGSRREREATARYARSQALGAPPPADSASVMGIPERELTPKVRAAIMTLMQEVDHLRGELERSQTRLAHLEQLADQDTLIPVPNRRAFVRELGRVISYSQRYETPASLIYLDVNEFKLINDRFGHAAGDAALLHVAQTLRAHLRESDVVGRLGGDEFGVILANANAERAREKAAELAERVAATPLEFHGESIAITLSYGSTTFTAGTSVSDAIDAADQAMYAYKAAKKTDE